MDVKIQRINAYDDVRFSERVLKQHGAFVINDELLCEVEIIGTCEAIVHGAVEEFYNEIIDEFRFYAEHICRFYNEKNELIKDGESYISLDGHTRLAVAVELGYEYVLGFLTVSNEYILAFAKEAKKRGINTPYDLKRVPHDEYEIVWNQFCDEQYIANVKNSFKDGRFAESFKRKRSGGITCSCRRKWRSKQVLSFAGKHKNSG